MKIIVGLGNPEEKYRRTYHNLGFVAAEDAAIELGLSFKHKKCRALVAEGFFKGEKIVVAKPQTYMNLSGESIREIADFYKIEPENIIIIYDDISLDVGRLRIRKKGSAGGHNGIKNIIAHLGTQEFPRIKVGIGNKPEGWDLADYVLSKYSKAEQEALKEASDDVIGAVRLMIMDDIDAAMNRYNAKKRDT